jgi:hypothetical protein
LSDPKRKRAPLESHYRKKLFLQRQEFLHDYY